MQFHVNMDIRKLQHGCKPFVDISWETLARALIFVVLCMFIFSGNVLNTTKSTSSSIKAATGKKKKKKIKLNCFFKLELLFWGGAISPSTPEGSSHLLGLSSPWGCPLGTDHSSNLFNLNF